VVIPAPPVLRTRRPPTWSAARDPDWRLRLRVLVGRRTLDREIAQAALPDANPARAMRAQQLSSSSERHAIAACLRNILQAADECTSDPGSRLALDHRTVIAAHSEIDALIDRLGSDSVLDVRGIALARLLAVDPTSPLVCPRSRRALSDALSEILDTL
jgi:hypothetical protein